MLTPAKDAVGRRSAAFSAGWWPAGRVLSIVDTEPAIRDRPDAVALPPSGSRWSYAT
ncbi:MAG: hypothetical protein WKG07_01505 [Hymenobacter sp.]